VEACSVMMAGLRTGPGRGGGVRRRDGDAAGARRRGRLPARGRSRTPSPRSLEAAWRRVLTRGAHRGRRVTRRPASAMQRESQAKLARASSPPDAPGLGAGRGDAACSRRWPTAVRHAIRHLPREPSRRPERGTPDVSVRGGDRRPGRAAERPRRVPSKRLTERRALVGRRPCCDRLCHQRSSNVQAAAARPQAAGSPRRGHLSHAFN